MENRALPPYLMKMREEPIPDDLYQEKVSNYRKGGFKKFEPDVAKRMGNVSIEQIYHTDPFTHESLRWLYVGDSWWCRKRNIILGEDKKKIRKVQYEFARLVAIENKKGRDKIKLARFIAAGGDKKKLIENKGGITHTVVGLWDTRIHAAKPEPEIVFDKDGKRGVILAYNEYEIIVEWDVEGKKSQSMIRNIEDLKFKFFEDYRKYLKVFELIQKHQKRQKGV
jgi:hypothetical protein